LARQSARQEERLDRLFHALGDRTRRSIVSRLAAGPASVTELAEPFSMTLPAVAKHIGVLERAGLVSSKRKDGMRQCALTGGAFDDAADWIEAHRALWTEVLDSLARYSEAGGRK
jgi:DNA-binding transcriptional ArsR family regulator